MTHVLNIVLFVVITAGILGMLFSGYMLFRNQKVYACRKEMLQKISKASQVDVEAGREYKWRYKEYERITHEKMMSQFWKPVTVDAFYGDVSFLFSNSKSA